MEAGILYDLRFVMLHGAAVGMSKHLRIVEVIRENAFHDIGRYTSAELFHTHGCMQYAVVRKTLNKEKHPLRFNTVDVLIFELSGGSDGT